MKYMDINELKEILLKSWSKETCSPGLRDSWSKENPSLGQCAITSMIVHDMFGGKIMRCMTSTGSHYYNMIDNKVVDLTVEQFLGKIPNYVSGVERTEEYLLSNEDTKKRYLMLANEVAYYIRLANSIEIEKIIEEISVRRRRIDKHFGGRK